MLLSPRDTYPAYAVASAYHMRPAAGRRSRLRALWFTLGLMVGIAVGMAVAQFRPTSSAEPESAKTSELAPEAPKEAKPADAAPAPLPDAGAKPQISAVQPAPGLELPAMVSIKVQKRETLASILADKGVSDDEVHDVIDSFRKISNPRKLAKGQKMILTLAHNPLEQDKASVLGLSLEESPLRSVTLTRSLNGFDTKEIKAPLYKSLAHAGGPIRSSLYQTAIDSGIPVSMVAEIIKAFSYDVDFQRDIHPGDKLDVVFEHTHTDKNVTTGIGKLMYASLDLGDKTLTIYRHTSTDGFTGYYNAKGESVRKALLRTPINGAHITSGFGMRMHPLLGYSKMHKGVDFGAPTGTPIYAAGDGVIVEAGRKGGYGNYVKLKHSKDYATAYGHASRIAKGIRPGVRVRQGQIIAYVGSTGASTGPHLHYEIMRDGAQVNPSGVKFRTGQQLAGKEFVAFKKQVKQVEAVLAMAPKKLQVASSR